MLFTVIAGGVLAFIAIAEEVSQGDTRAVDQRILLALRNPANPEQPWGPVWLVESGRDISALGSAAMLTLVTAAVAGFLVLQRKRRLAVLTVAAVVSGTLLQIILKQAFGRTRPELVPLGAAAHTYSFPSGHSMMSAIVYFSLGALLASALRRRAMKAYVLTLAVVTPILVGISRVYLAVHWPTDVLAGWAAGAVWAILWCLIAGWLEPRRPRGEQNGAGDPETQQTKQTRCARIRGTGGRSSR